MAAVITTIPFTRDNQANMALEVFQVAFDVDVQATVTASKIKEIIKVTIAPTDVTASTNGVYVSSGYGTNAVVINSVANADCYVYLEGYVG